MDKRNIRIKLGNERKALNKKYRSNRDALLSRKIADFVKKRRYIASYCSYNNEINPNTYLDINRLYFPKVKDNKMFLCMPRTGFIKGYKGIKEPFGRFLRIDSKKIDAIIVPGVAFDKRGYRVGYGMGFYDRFLKKFRGLKIGVAYECCIVDHIDEDKHDIRMDYVISEKRNIICKLRRRV